MEHKIEPNDLVERLKQLIDAQEAERKTANSNHNNNRNDLIIDQLKDILNETTVPKKPKKVKKKKIKRQDLLKEILEGSVLDNSAKNPEQAQFSNQNEDAFNTVNNNLDVNFDDLGLFEDSHRFGFNFYSEGFQNNLVDKAQNSENNKINESNEVQIKKDTENKDYKDFFKYRSKEMFENYLEKFQLKEMNENISYDVVINEDIDVLGYARDRNMLPMIIPKPEEEVLKILGLPIDYNPFTDKSNNPDQKLSYDPSTNAFRVKHSLLTNEEEKDLKKHRNRVASRKFRKARSKKQKVDEVAMEYKKNLQYIIDNITPEIKNLETNVLSLINENQQLGDALKLKHKNRLST